MAQKRSERTRVPSHTAFPEDFVGELWEKLRIPAKNMSDSQEGTSTMQPDMNDINPGSPSSVAKSVDEHRKGQGSGSEMGHPEEMINFQATLTEAEDHDDHTAALSQRLAQSQKEYIELQFAMSVMQEKLQRMEGSTSGTIMQSLKTGGHKDDDHHIEKKLDFTRPAEGGPGRGGMWRRGGGRRQDWRPRVQYGTWKTKTAVVASSSYVPPAATGGEVKDIGEKEVAVPEGPKVGKPLYTDRITANLERFTYARVCVEVAADKELPKTIPIVTEGGEVRYVKVQYEWVPCRCSHCTIFGHKTDMCKAAKNKEGEKEVHIQHTEGIVITDVAKDKEDIVEQQQKNTQQNKDLDLSQIQIEPGDTGKVGDANPSAILSPVSTHSPIESQEREAEESEPIGKEAEGEETKFLVEQQIDKAKGVNRGKKTRKKGGTSGKRGGKSKKGVT